MRGKNKRRILVLLWCGILGVNSAAAGAEENSAGAMPEPPCYRELGEALARSAAERFSRVPGALSAGDLQARLENLEQLRLAGFQPILFDSQLIRFTKPDTAAFRIDGRMRSEDGAARVRLRFCAEARVEAEGRCTVLRFQPRGAILWELERERVESGDAVNCYTEEELYRPTEAEMKELYDRARRFIDRMDGKPEL